MRADDVTVGLSQVVLTLEEYERRMADALPDLLNHATTSTRRFLREVGQWEDDVCHEKLALRWGYELVERFLLYGRGELPCRPLFCLDGLIAHCFSKPDPFSYGLDLCSPLGRFVDALMSRAVISRNALMLLFYHLYGFGPSRVAKVLGLDATASQRIYKNFERWRHTGWQRAVDEAGLSQDDLLDIESSQIRSPHVFNAEAERLVGMVQTHYRKSEPEHFLCLSREEWRRLFHEGYGYDYRLWHLALCWTCLRNVCQVHDQIEDQPMRHLDLRIRPVLSNRMSIS
ncbi:MAG: hypothetical protein M3Z35_05550 [Nitrospirota bacterium]|nr:hypothetical protein [Nitrospirota bacterium]